MTSQAARRAEIEAQRAAEIEAENEATERAALQAPPPPSAPALKKIQRVDLMPVVYAPDLAKPLPKFCWLSKSFALIQGRVLVFTGYGDACKTFGAMDVGLAVATGAPKAMGDLDLGLAGPVIHVDYEQQADITSWRYQRLAHGRGIDLAALGEKLGVVSMPPVMLNTDAAERELTRVLTGKALAIVDNLTAGCKNLDQNSSAAAEPLYMLGRVSSVTKCTVICIHHDNKSPADGQTIRPRAQQMRGSGAIHAAIGGGLAFTKQDGGIIRYESLKETMGPKPEPGFFRVVDVGEVDPNTERSIGLRLDWIPPEEAGEKAAGKVEAFSVQVARVVDYVRANPGKATASSMSFDTKIRKAVACDAFTSAAADGLIENRGSKVTPKWYVVPTVPDGSREPVPMVPSPLGGTRKEPPRGRGGPGTA